MMQRAPLPDRRTLLQQRRTVTLEKVPAGNLFFRIHHDEDAEIFARNLYDTGCIDERDWKMYCQMYESISTALSPLPLALITTALLPGATP